MTDKVHYHIQKCDALTWLGQLPDESMDLIITDPPYESLEEHRSIGTTTRLKHSKASSNDWFEIFPNAQFPELFTEIYRVLRNDRHFYLFCDAKTAFVVQPWLEASSFHFWKPLVWDKQKIGMGYHYRARYEFILFCEKGKRKLNDLSIPDVLSVPRVFGGYPTEKPVELSEILIKQSCEEGEWVADPFMGSASVGEAALRTGLHFCGADITPHALKRSKERLERFGDSGELPCFGDNPQLGLGF